MLYLQGEKVCICGFPEVLSQQKSLGLQITNYKLQIRKSKNDWVSKVPH
jgi:hypothetical protein